MPAFGRSEPIFTPEGKSAMWQKLRYTRKFAQSPLTRIAIFLKVILTVRD